MNLLTGLLALAAIAYVLVRRLAGEPLEGRRPLTVVVWVGSLLVRVGQTAAGHAVGADSNVLGAALLGVLGLSLLAEALVVGKRALGAGVPFAPQGSRRRR